MYEEGRKEQRGKSLIIIFMCEIYLKTWQFLIVMYFISHISDFKASGFRSKEMD